MTENWPGRKGATSHRSCPLGWAAATIVLALLLSGESQAWAQIIAPGARTVFAETTMYRTTLRYTRSEGLLEGSSSVPGSGDHHAQRWVWDHSLARGIAPGWTAAGVLRLVSLETDEPGMPDQEEKGIGDPLLILQYDGLYRKNHPRGFSRLALQGRVLLPVGEEPFTRDSFDLGLALIGTRVKERHWLGGDLNYVLATGGPGDIERGDILGADVYYLYRLGSTAHQRALLVGEINARHQKGDRRGSSRVPNTGGDTIALTMGAEIFLSDQSILEAAVSLPIYRDLNGVQPDIPVLFLVGLRRLF